VAHQPCAGARGARPDDQRIVLALDPQRAAECLGVVDEANDLAILGIGQRDELTSPKVRSTLNRTSSPTQAKASTLFAAAAGIGWPGARDATPRMRMRMVVIVRQRRRDEIVLSITACSQLSR
jgi:hypothetical protein